MSEKRNYSHSENIEYEDEYKWCEINHPYTSRKYFSREVVEWPSNTIERSDDDLNTDKCQPAQKNINNNSPIYKTEKKSETGEEIESEKCEHDLCEMFIDECNETFFIR